MNSSSALGILENAKNDNRYGIRSPMPERNRALDPYIDAFSNSKPRNDYGSIKARD